MSEDELERDTCVSANAVASGFELMRKRRVERAVFFGGRVHCSSSGWTWQRGAGRQHLVEQMRSLLGHADSHGVSVLPWSRPGCCVSGASMLHPVPHLHMLCGERDVLEEAMLSLREVRAETGGPVSSRWVQANLKGWCYLLYRQYQQSLSDKSS